MTNTAETTRSPRRPSEIERGERIRFGEDVYFAVMDFLIQEARILDNDDHGEWVKLLAPDIFYYMSQQRTMPRGERQLDVGSYWYYENIETLEWRVAKFIKAKSFYAEDPPSRFRRYVSNLTLFRSPKEGEYVAESYVLLARNRGDAPDYQLLSCKREDVLRIAADGSITIVQRHIIVDQSVLGTHNISFFL